MPRGEDEAAAEAPNSLVNSKVSTFLLALNSIFGFVLA